jgi:hypothetical protein
MLLDLQAVFTGLLALVCTVLGWFARELWAAVKALQRDLAALEVRVTRDYVSYDRLADALRPVIDGLAEIKKALHEKADKP